MRAVTWDPENSSGLSFDAGTATFADAAAPGADRTLRDPFGRAVTYLRVSVTDRCDFRCVYCMAEQMTFLPRRELLTLEELDRLCTMFVGSGIRKLRITGGEPLVRRGIMTLFRALSRHIASGALDELTLTTNAGRLAEHATELAACGVRRVNISLDTLNEARFRAITRIGDLARVRAGIDAAVAAGLRVKINVVALRGVNDDEIPDLMRWCAGRGFEMTLIEVMPMGEIGGDNRLNQYLPLAALRDRLAEHWTLTPLDVRTGGPARFVRVEELGLRLGFIAPLTHNFCESCNRVRLTCTGQLYLCLGRTESADLRAVLRGDGGDAALAAAIGEAIGRKPKGHDFVIDRDHRTPAVARYMSITGG
ncbi:MAG: GTP 3',8-cyclase MoaA [Rhodospirillales bacterium]|nr:GTP 3',8-cyclase MoaA [Rhodospirillales bacterium]